MVDTDVYGSIHPCGRQQKQNTSDLIKKSRGISDLFIGGKHLTKITHKFYKIHLKQHGGQESAKLLQYGRDSCNLFKTFALEHILSQYGAKSHEMVHNNPLLPVYVVYSLHTVE